MNPYHDFYSGSLYYCKSLRKCLRWVLGKKIRIRWLNMEFQWLLGWLHASCLLQLLYLALSLGVVRADVSMRDAASLRRVEWFRFLWVFAQVSKCLVQRVRHPFPIWGSRALLGTWRNRSRATKLNLLSCLWPLRLKNLNGRYSKGRSQWHIVQRTQLD